jgi:Sulfotransferase family
MFVTDKLVYLQLQKTGCTHIVRVMNELVGGRSVGRKHGRLEKDFALNGRTIIGSVRNPWSWYVSLWAFGCQREGAVYGVTTSRRFGTHFYARKEHANQWLGGVWKEFVKPTAHWKRLYADSDNPALFREWLKTVFDRNRAHDLGQGFGYSTLREYAGLLTYRYARLYLSDAMSLFSPDGLRTLDDLRAFDRQHNLARLMIRTESLEDDLIAVLRAVDHSISQAAEAKIRSAQRTNTSRHKSFVDYYDAETIALVAQKEALIIEKHGYAAPPG